MRQPLSEIAHRALTVVETRTRQQGQDLFQELNRVGLIATEPRIQEIQVAALKNMFDRLETVSVTELMEAHNRGNSNPGTPADLHRAIVAWIRAYIDYIEHD